MRIFGRKRYQARQNDHAANLYQHGIAFGRDLFAQCLAPSPTVQACAQKRQPWAVGVVAGYESALWEWEDECRERLEALGRDVVEAAEHICAEAVGIDLGPTDVHGGEE